MLTVPAEAAGTRLDVFVVSRCAGVSRAKIQKLVTGGHVQVNGRVATGRTKLKGGERIEIHWPPSPPMDLAPIAMALDIVFEDEHLVVINKPAGLAVHPGAGAPTATLVHGLLAHCQRLGRPTGADPTTWERPGIVHRLDKDTTGVIVCAKTDRAHADLAKQFHDKKTLEREYVALLDGLLAAEVVAHESYLARDPQHRQRFKSFPSGAQPQKSRWAKSYFFRTEVLGGRLTLARVRLVTGRTHQIRLHAVDLRAPIVGDPLYHRPLDLPRGFSEAARRLGKALNRQLLHAGLLGFDHPVTGARMRFTAPLPADFQSFLANLAV